MTTNLKPPITSSRVGFVDAVRRFWILADQFHGRSSRSEYWFGILHVAVVLGVVGIIGTILDATTSAAGDFFNYLIVPAFAALVTVPSLALQARRVHDTGRSAWWLLLSLVPGLGGVVLLVFTLLPSTGENRFDRHTATPRKRSKARLVPIVVAYAVGQAVTALVVLGAILELTLSSAIDAGLPESEQSGLTAINIPGLLDIRLADGMPFGLDLDINGIGWLVTSYCIALVVFAWRRAAHDREARITS